MEHSRDSNSRSVSGKTWQGRRRNLYKKIKHFKAHGKRKTKNFNTFTDGNDRKKSLKGSLSQLKFPPYLNFTTLPSDINNWEESKTTQIKKEDLDCSGDKREHSARYEMLQENNFENEKLLPECDIPEFVEVINGYNEVVYLQRNSIQAEKNIVRTGFLFLSSLYLHWGEILTAREIYVIDGSGSIICKDLKSDTKEDFCISKGENFVLFPGCNVELRKNSDTELLKLFIVYL